MTPRQPTDESPLHRLLNRTPAVLLALVMVSATLALAAGSAAANPAMPGRIYADGDVFATRGLTDLPAPNDNNAQSFDTLYVVQGGVADQHAVAEAAPGETDYNGGRWAVTVVEWTEGTTPYLLTSDDAVEQAIANGDLRVVTVGARYFECPLVPVRG